VVRPAEELLAADPAWPALRRQLARAAVPVRVLPAPPGPDVLYRLQVTTASVLGALALQTGGLVLEHGWLRLLGGGAEGLPDLAAANGLPDPADPDAGPPPFLVVAHDVLGGLFALDGGGLGIAPGEVCSWGPDTLEWTGLGAGHAAFLAWALDGGAAEFYEGLRWPGWEQEVAAVPLDRGLSLDPPPFTREGQDVAAASRRPVPFAELSGFYAEMAEQIEGGVSPRRP
jgi:hypothetical protein